MAVTVKTAFRLKVIPLPIAQLLITRPLTDAERKHEKYHQIAASMKVLGLVEPVIVHPQGRGKYRVLDGRKRVTILLDEGAQTVACVISTDDESFTYNHRVNYLSTVGEHQMILKALRHNTEEDIAKALNVDVSVVREKRNLLNGICPEAADVLKASRVAPGAFVNMRKMKPVRQVEAAELMLAANNFTARFAQALLMGTSDDMRIEPQRQDRRYISPAQRAHLAHETDALLRKAKAVEASYGTNLLNLSVCLRYVESVVGNQAARRFLDARYPELLREFQAIGASQKRGLAPDNQPERRTMGSSGKRG